MDAAEPGQENACTTATRAGRMYAAIRRYTAGNTAGDDLAEAGHQLGVALSKTTGFVAAVAVEVIDGGLITIGLFEDRAGLLAAEAVAERWAAAHHATLGAFSGAAISGEVVAQRGL
jgi:hypothetical protein